MNTICPCGCGQRMKKPMVRRSSQKYKSYTLPIVRQVFPTLIASEFVSVQPMSGPTGLSFPMDYKTTTSSNNNNNTI